MEITIIARHATSQSVISAPTFLSTSVNVSSIKGTVYFHSHSHFEMVLFRKSYIHYSGGGEQEDNSSRQKS
jgi:hypothetical protein